MIASQQRDKLVVRAHVRGDNVEDSHLRAGRVARTGSHKRWLVDEQFRVHCNIRRRGSRHVVGGTRDRDNEPIAEDAQEEIEVPKVLHPSETIEVLEAPNPFEREALNTTEVTLQMATEAPVTNDTEVTPPIETDVLLQFRQCRMYPRKKGFLETN